MRIGNAAEPDCLNRYASPFSWGNRVASAREPTPGLWYIDRRWAFTVRTLREVFGSLGIGQPDRDQAG
jgi:hypothetical protein